MSSARESVEHQFDVQDALFPNMKLFTRIKLKSNFPLEALYFSRVLLTNLHACLNGNQTVSRMKCTPPTLEEYMG